MGLHIVEDTNLLDFGLLSCVSPATMVYGLAYCVNLVVVKINKPQCNVLCEPCHEIDSSQIISFVSCAKSEKLINIRFHFEFKVFSLLGFCNVKKSIHWVGSSEGLELTVLTIDLFHDEFHSGYNHGKNKQI